MGGGYEHASNWWHRRGGGAVAAATFLVAGLVGVAAVDADAAPAGAPAFFVCSARTTDTGWSVYRVPSGATRVAITAAGGKGAHEATGGRGAFVTAVAPVAPGENLFVVAGCDASGHNGGRGWGDGGDGGRGIYRGGGGGGGSVVLAQRGPLVVAGGGGGGGGGGTRGDGGHGSGTNAGNRRDDTIFGGRGENGFEGLLGDYYSNGGGGGGGGARGGRGGEASFTPLDDGKGGKGGSSMVTPQAEPGSRIVAGGAPSRPGFVVIVPLTGQGPPTVLTFQCRPGDPFFYDSFTVPAGASQMFTVVKGGGGGDVGDTRGGRGAIVQGTLPVTPGEQYRAKAGCKGYFGIFSGGNGYGNGGGGGPSETVAGGGGGSAVLTLNWRALVIAGGGGGAGGPYTLGDGNAGGDGSLTGEAGRGSGGGAGGAREVVHGGDGDQCSVVFGSGGGGGGGLRGGAGGDVDCRFSTTGGGGGGGGGSSLQPPGGTTATLQSGPRSDGLVVVVLV